MPSVAKVWAVGRGVAGVGVVVEVALPPRGRNRFVAPLLIAGVVGGVAGFGAVGTAGSGTEVMLSCGCCGNGRTDDVVIGGRSGRMISTSSLRMSAAAWSRLTIASVVARVGVTFGGSGICARTSTHVRRSLDVVGSLLSVVSFTRCGSSLRFRICNVASSTFGAVRRSAVHLSTSLWLGQSSDVARGEEDARVGVEASSSTLTWS